MPGVFFVTTTRHSHLVDVLDSVDNNELAGWFFWTAFDFPLTVTCYEPGCVNQDSADHHFGLWATDYSPKLAVGVIQIATGTK